ncbi:DUF7134 domain-containing protein [Bifidobacterium miconis]|uniref:sensor histidine kinase n=1 Tax=Bifidobacterium miconis TaxID=2834435 RepID=UPI001F42208D|nr:histidine kinase [Bifidobacterium miconis]
MTRRLTTIRDIFARNRRTRALAVDSIAALLAALAFGLLFGTSVGNMPGMLFSYDIGPTAAWSVALALPLAIRRVRPQTAALIFASLAAIQLVLGPAMVPSDFLALVMLYSVIVYGDPRNTTAFIVLASAVGALAGPVMAWALDLGPLFDPYITPDEYAQAVPGSIPDCRAVYAGGGFTGSCAQMLLQESAIYLAAIAACLAATVIAAFWQRARLITIRMMQERNEALEASEAEERRIAALAERARIARDMHDVVAHTLSIIIVQSDGGRYAGAHDPAVARHTMETIRHESERALHDMKRLFGVFGGSSHADYADIGALVDQARAAAGSSAAATSTAMAATSAPSSDIAAPAAEMNAASASASSGPFGDAIVRRVSGTVRPELLTAAASTAVYHLVQESLTNVRKYAGPNAHVRIDERWSDRALEIIVSDDGRGAASALDGHKPGYGLLGMRERVEAAGGTVTAGPQVGGGFAVHAVVPLRGAEAAQAAPVQLSGTEPADRPVVAMPAGDFPARSGNASFPAATPLAHARSSAISIEQADFPVMSTKQANSPIAAKQANSHVMPTERSERRHPSSPALPQLPTWARLHARLRSKPIAQAGLANGKPFNWVERLSQWTERHYLATDIIGTLLLTAIMCSNTISMFDGYLYGTTGELAIGRFIVVTTMLPLCFRRRFPEGAALAVVIASTFQLVVFQPVLFSNLFALCALYSAVLYGRPTAWRWTGCASAAVAVLFGFKVALSSYGYDSILHWMLRTEDFAVSAVPSMFRLWVEDLSWAALVGAMCTGTILLARWQRSNGSNVLVLQAREEALRAEQAKQKVLAANMERDRISANIQNEVSETLTSVIDRTVAGIRMMNEAEAHGTEPSAESIAAAFAAIGQQGRSALKRMRQLLNVLRETGFSDEAHGHAQPEMQLRPAALLDEQLGAAHHG